MGADGEGEDILYPCLSLRGLALVLWDQLICPTVSRSEI